MSKIEAGKYTLHLEDVDLDEVMDTSIRVVRLRAQEMGVVIDRMVGPQPVVVRVDRRAVKQILLNLVSNAIKFTPEGGRVVISVECVEQRVLLRVADTGIGIPEEDLPRLARPFEQAGTAEHNEKRSGTGLGLALVKALTELHGGALRIDSKIGKGTVVTVELPFEPATARQAPLAASA
jgi:signal transduction histidine kinase